MNITNSVLMIGGRETIDMISGALFKYLFVEYKKYIKEKISQEVYANNYFKKI